MTIYYSLIGFIGLCSFFTLGMNDNYKRNKIIVMFSSIFIIIIQGLRRTTVGVDLIGYIPALQYAKNMNFISGEKLYNYELGYSLYSQFFSKLNVSDQAYLFIVALTIIIPIAYVWIKNSKMPGLSVLIYITLGFFVFSFSGLRQSIAISIAFFSFRYVQEKKLIKFLLCVALAMSFHSSAIVFFAAYPLYYMKLKQTHYFFIIPGFILAFIFKSKIFLIIYKLYRGFEGEVEATNAYTMLLIMIFVLILSYIFGSKDKDNLNINAYKNYMLVTIFLQIFASQSNIAMRAGYYYYIFITLLIPEVIKNQRDKNVRLLATIFLIGSLLYFFQVNAGSGYLNVSPYYFYWE